MFNALEANIQFFFSLKYKRIHMDTHVKEEERNNVEKIIIDMQRNNKLLNAGGLAGCWQA